MKCERCGQELSGNYSRHMRLCNRLPKSRVLAQEWLDGASYDTLATRYGVGAETVRRRVLSAGVTREQTKKRQSLNSGDWQRPGTCSVCSIRLDIPEARPVRDGLCGVCADARPKRRSFSLDEACAAVVAERVV